MAVQSRAEEYKTVLKHLEHVEPGKIVRPPGDNLLEGGDIIVLNENTIIAHNNPSCARINQILEGLGYTVEEVGFDGVPATGGSLRCASLALSRLGDAQPGK
jgi:N-dimethylarginine dimethylaminohydrolase